MEMWDNVRPSFRWQSAMRHNGKTTPRCFQ